jgi:hypothetical protein
MLKPHGEVKLAFRPQLLLSDREASPVISPHRVPDALPSPTNIVVRGNNFPSHHVYWKLDFYLD